MVLESTSPALPLEWWLNWQNPDENAGFAIDRTRPAHGHAAHARRPRAVNSKTGIFIRVLPIKPPLQR